MHLASDDDDDDDDDFRVPKTLPFKTRQSAKPFW